MKKIGFDNELYVKQIKDLFENHKLTRGKILSAKNNKHLLEYVLQNTQFLKNANYSTRMFFVINNVSEPLKCLTCGKILDIKRIYNLNAKNFRDAFIKFCSPRCGCLYEETIQYYRIPELVSR